MADAPLTTEEVAAAVAAVVATTATGLVLAVSGGPDSMALLHGVAALAARGALPPVTVGTVDHGLQPASAAQAGRVCRAAETFGLPCRTLTWDGDKPSRGIQDAARRARYRLLGTLCRDVGADHLLTAHTADDQAETVLMRLARGSGLAGLAAMRGRTLLGAVVVARPLLGVPKARLVATCQAHGIAFDHDPANLDPRFERTRLRALSPVLSRAGLDTPALLRLAARSARADEALASVANRAFEDCRRGGGLQVAGLAFGPREILVRVLARAVAEAGGSAGRLARLEGLAARLAEAAQARRPLGATLGGVVMQLDATGRLALRREGLRRRGRKPLPPSSAAAESLSWQG